MAHPRAPQEMALLVTDLTAGENTLGKAHLPGEELCSSSELPLISPKFTENAQSDLCGLGAAGEGWEQPRGCRISENSAPKKRIFQRKERAGEIQEGETQGERGTNPFLI